MDSASIIIGFVLLLGAYSYIQQKGLSLPENRPDIRDIEIPPNIKNAWDKLKREYTFPLWIIIIIGVLMFMFK